MIVRIAWVFCLLFYLKASATETPTKLNITVTQTNFTVNNFQLNVTWNAVVGFNGQYEIQYQPFWPLISTEWKILMAKRNDILLSENLLCGSKYRIKIYYSFQSTSYFDATYFVVGKSLPSINLVLQYDEATYKIMVQWKTLRNYDIQLHMMSNSSCQYIEMKKQCSNTASKEHFEGCTLTCAVYTRNINQYVKLSDLKPNTKYVLSIFRTQNGLTEQFCQTQWTQDRQSSSVTQVIIVPRSNSLNVKWSPPLNPGGLIQHYYLQLTNSSTNSCAYISCQDCFTIERYTTNITIKDIIGGNCKLSCYSSFSIKNENLQSTFHNLRPFTNYSVSILPINGMGIGNESEWEIQTLEEKPGKCDVLKFKETTLTSWTFIAKCNYPNGQIWHYEYYLITSQSKSVRSTKNVQYTIQNLLPCIEYCVSVRAVNAIGSGEWSDKQCFRTKRVIPPIPTGVKAKGIYADTISIKWKPYISNCNYGFQVEKSSNGQKEYKYTTTKSYSWKELPQGVTFSFRVRGIVSDNRNETGPWSKTVNCTTKLQKPGEPRNIVLTEPNDHSLNIKWDPPSPPNNVVSNYTLYTNNSKIITLNQSTTNYALHNITPCTYYCIRIISSNQKGAGKSDYKCLMTNPNVPARPTILNTTGISADTIRITWSIDDTCPLRFLVNKYPDNIAKEPFQTFYEWRNLSQGNKFKFRIKAITKTDNEKEGSWSAWSIMATTILQTPDEPRNIVLTQPNDYSVNMKWDPPSPPNNAVSSYTLYSNNSKITTVNQLSTKYILYNIKPCTFYCITITSSNQMRDGKSNDKCVKTNPKDADKCTDTSKQFQNEVLNLIRSHVKSLNRIANYQEIFIKLYSDVHNMKLKVVPKT